jgi:hypothetical protein
MKQVVLFLLTCVALKAQRAPFLIKRDFENAFIKASTEMATARNINTKGNDMLRFLVEMEEPNTYSLHISADTRELIVTQNNVYGLVLLERSLQEDTGINLFMKEKLLLEVDDHIDRLNRDQLTLYTYDTRRRSVINFVGIRSGNDLFTLTGLFSSLVLPRNKEVKDGNVIFQRNDDRDYTGSFLVEIGTSYLNVLRRRPLKTYQTLLYGFDVYTPYFKDSIIFSHDTSYNIHDRPHASFQYFGWSKKGLSWGNKYRWSTTIKIGTIGGTLGQNFQNALHQDISYSPRPKGWGSQISRNGRIGLSVEGKQEFAQIPVIENNISGFRVFNLLLSPFTEEKIGTYMTTGGFGLQVSNKRFAENSHNFINHRTRQTVYHWSQHIYYNMSFSSTYIFHNTMLEGYGIFSSKEEFRDNLTPLSRYYLSSNRVERLVHKLNITLSYTTRFATIFYNWMSISPETNNSLIGIPSRASGAEMNISKRWHHFAEIGVTFNIR